ncbi:hypothetical protein [Paraburkholderia sp. WSM4177]|uniref:hypothetical protein n=1 Tax=unclassified Paraburkholderia TaxID=2615204 RepID=UPI0018546AC2|nr:hypothetical protein [Paraburkholderia sp. WSM4177]MBB5488050.1 hypothetical protein [Paraburkholderia sp. WSM4180]
MLLQPMPAVHMPKATDTPTRSRARHETRDIGRRARHPGTTHEAAEPAVDGGAGTASVGLEAQQEPAVTAMATRLRSDPSSDPTTGAELGSEVPRSNDLG